MYPACSAPIAEADIEVLLLAGQKLAARILRFHIVWSYGRVFLQRGIYGVMNKPAVDNRHIADLDHDIIGLDICEEKDTTLEATKLSTYLD